MMTDRFEHVVTAIGVLILVLCAFSVAEVLSVGAAFSNPIAVEQACDNNPKAVRVALEQTLTQEQVDAVEARLVPAPTLEQQEADLKTALTLVKRVSEDTSKDPAVAAIQVKLDAIEAMKPEPEVIETLKPEPEPIEEPVERLLPK